MANTEHLISYINQSHCILMEFRSHWIIPSAVHDPLSLPCFDNRYQRLPSETSLPCKVFIMGCTSCCWLAEWPSVRPWWKWFKLCLFHVVLRDAIFVADWATMNYTCILHWTHILQDPMDFDVPHRNELMIGWGDWNTLWSLYVWWRPGNIC